MMAAVALVAMGVSAAMTAYSAIKQGQAAKDSANYNATIASQNANTALAQGQAASEAQARASQQRMGAAVASYGASGVESDSGSAADILSQGARTSALDNLTTKYNAQLKAIGYEDQENLDQAQASNAMPAAYLSAAGSLLSTAGSAYFMSTGGTKIPRADAAGTGGVSLG